MAGPVWIIQVYVVRLPAPVMFRASSKNKYSPLRLNAPGFHVTLRLWALVLLPSKLAVASGEAVNSTAPAPPGSFERKILALKVAEVPTCTVFGRSPKESVQLPAANEPVYAFCVRRQSP